MTRLTDEDLKEARRDADGFKRGVFRCEEVEKRHDGRAVVTLYEFVYGIEDENEYNQYTISGDIDAHIAEPIARMLNMFPCLLAEVETLLAEVAALKGELASHREVADPDGEHPELSTRDCIMHLGEQAALLTSVNRMAEKRGAERDAAQDAVVLLTKERDEMQLAINNLHHASAICRENEYRLCEERDRLRTIMECIANRKAP